MITNLQMKKGARLLVGTILAALLLPTAPANAGSFQVNPVHVLLEGGKAATSLTVMNSDAEPVSIRVITYRWTQEKGEDVYSDTKDIIASPPIFTVPAGGTQIVRFGLRTRTAGASYRVILEEIPSENSPKRGIKIALRVDLPFYVLNKQGEAKVSWAAYRGPDGDIALEAENQGSRHEQVLEISAIGPAGKKSQLSKQMGVVLPTSVRHWKIGKRPEISTGTPLLLNIRTAEREIQTQVIVQSR